nr:hypothetical protein [Tanacetum cinerariifolium]
LLSIFKLSCVVYKGIQDGLIARVDHDKAGRDLFVIESYDPSAKAKYIDVVNALGAVDFSLLSELKSKKDASMVDLMDSLHLEGYLAEILRAKDLQPSSEQLMLPLHRLKDNVVLGETSLSFSLQVPLSSNSLIGEAGTSATPEPITNLSTTFTSSGVVPPLSISNDQVLDTKPNDADPPAVTFEEEELATSLESTIPLRDIISQLPLSIFITISPPVLPIEDPDDSLIIGNEDLNTILKKESDEVIKSSVEDLVPIPSEFEDTSERECDFPADDESLSNEDVLKDNVKTYSNPLFEIDDSYIFSDVNPLFDEMLEDIESKASYDSNLDEPALLVTPLFDYNEDECFDPGGDVDEIDAFDIPSDFKDDYYDSEGDVLYLESLLSDDTTPNLPLEVFLGHDPRSLSDINDLKIKLLSYALGVENHYMAFHLVDGFPVIHQPPQETSIKILHDQENIINVVQTFLRKFNRISFFETPKVLLLTWDRVFKIKDAFGNKQYKPEDIQELFRKLLNDLQNIHEELAKYINTPSWNRHAFYNINDDDDEDCTIAIIPNEPVDSLIMEDEHLDTISATESDKFIKSSVDNLVPIPTESEGENKCDVPAGFTTFSNVLFDADYDFYSRDDQSFFDEDLPKRIYLNPLFDEEIIPMKIDPHPFNAESDLIESMPNHDSSIIISSKIDSLFDEYAGKLTLLKSISPGIDETDCHPEEETHFTKRLLYDNSSPRPPKEFVSDNSNANIESFSPSPILIKDSDPLMEEIDLSFTSDDPMPPSIEEDDDDSERDIPILEELLDNYSLLIPENESYHFDIPSSSRPPATPQMEKSPDLLSHQGLEIFQPSAKYPMIINKKNTPILDVPLFYF